MSAKQLFLHPAAIEEAEAAARWYRERSPKAAARFVDEIEQVIDKLRNAPHRWPLGPHGTRRIRFPYFPFTIIYRESTEAIQILAFAHGRRRPGYWKARL
jgi:plasmid stabilization system protein ParE